MDDASSLPSKDIFVPDRPDLGGHRLDFPIVGVGASAGGLEAFQDFVGALARDVRTCFVLVQHLDPNHESLLPELLARHTELPIEAISGTTEPRPGRIYLLPPGKGLILRDGQLVLRPFSEPRGQRRPIDDFFTSLAADQTTNAACVVLSGTGADGSEGLRAIKEAGGLTVAQIPAEAAYDGMPSSAVATGLVDLIVPANEIPRVIENYFMASFDLLERSGELEGSFLSRIAEAVRYRTGHDFSGYKPTTLSRRVARRMQVVGISDQGDYVRLLMGNADEAQVLMRDLLINVTNFFRDPEAFDALRRKVIPELVQGKGKGDHVRIWVPGCSSGEEAYSIAILIAEELQRRETGPSVNIFATDIDQKMLSIAREAIYPLTAVADVPPDLLSRYFLAEEKGFRIMPGIREMVRVSEHSVIKDPPFSKLDMISCRNLLIYFDNDLQDRVLPIFHYALKSDGVLFLGPSENLGTQSDLMTAIDQGARIFRRGQVPSGRLNLPLAIGRHAKSVPPLTAGSDKRNARPNGRFDEDAVRQLIVNSYAPPFVLVDPAQEIVYASGRTGRFLELSGGKPSTKILDMARPGLRSALRAVLATPAGARRRVVSRGIEVEIEGQSLLIDVSSEAVENNLRLIVFQERAPKEAAEAGDEGVDVTQFTEEERIRELEDELAETRMTLRSTVEELETSNEELKSSNEEMMSMNEELQSANEELSTMNDELKNKVEALADAHDDMQNLLDSTRIALVFLDGDLRIRSFTPEASAVLNLSDQDCGRAIVELSTRTDTARLNALSTAVLETLEPHEARVEIAEDNHDYILRVLPYRTGSDEIRGVVLVFTDVTEMSHNAAALDAARADAELRLAEIEQLYGETPIAMGLVDRQHRYLRLNQRLAELNGLSIEDAHGKSIDDLLPGISKTVAFAIDEVLETEKPVTGLELWGDAGTLGDRSFVTSWYPYPASGPVTGVWFVIQDVTSQKERDRQLNHLMNELQHRVKNVLANVVSLVRQAERSKQSPEEALSRLSERLHSMAKTNNLLSMRNWRSAELRDLVEAEVIRVYGGERCDMSGPDIELNSEAVLAFAMALHEMATNAAKYGALSVEDGMVEIAWHLEDRGQGAHLVFAWTEEAALPAPEPSDATGFGSQLISVCFEQTLGGTLSRELSPTGMRYRAVLAQDAVLLDD